MGFLEQDMPIYVHKVDVVVWMLGCLLRVRKYLGYESHETDLNKDPTYFVILSGGLPGFMSYTGGLQL